MLKKIIAILIAAQLCAVSLPVLAEEDVLPEETAQAESISEEEGALLEKTSGEETAAEEKPEEPETIPLKNNESIALMALGIFAESDCTDSQKAVTRADFARMIYYFSAKDERDNTIRYPDTDEAHAAYLNYAVKRGYLEAASDGKINPDGEVKSTAVIKAVVTELGYEQIAKYEKGYVNAAQKLGLLSYVQDYDAGVTYREMSEFLYHALMTEEGKIRFEDGKMQFEMSEESYLEGHFDAELRQGTIRGTERTQLDKSEGCGTGAALIDGIRYDTAISLNDLLGCRVRYVVQTKDNVDTVIAVLDVEKYTDILEIDALKIESFENNTYRYDDGKNIKTARLDAGKTLIYNGKYAGVYIPEYLTPKNGKVRLVDANQDGRYETVLVTSLKTFIVRRNDTEHNKLYEKNGSFVIDLEQYQTVDVLQDGKEVKISGIKDNYILSVAESLDKDAVTLYSSNTVKTDIMTYIGEGDYGYEITIGSDRYQTESEYFKQYTDPVNISSGKKMKMYFDCQNRIVWIEAVSSDMSYGYLVRAGRDEDDKLYFKIFTQDGALVSGMRAAERVKVDGKSYKAEKDDILDILKKGTDEPIPQLIRYRLNSDGLIAEIDTPYNNQPKGVTPGVSYLARQPGEKETKDSFRMIYASSMMDNPSKQWYKAAGPTWGRYPVVVAGRPSTLVCVVPANLDGATAQDFKFSAVDDYFEYDKSYLIDAYSVTANNAAADVIVVIDDSAASTDTIKGYDVGMIEKISEVYMEDAEEVGTLLKIGTSERVDTVYATEEKYYKTVKPVDGGVYKDTYELEKGDIVWYDVDSKNHITAIRLVYDASETDPNKAFKGSSNRIYGDMLTYPRMAFLDVYDVVDGYARCTTQDLTDFTGSPDSLNLTVERIDFFGLNSLHRYDSKTKKVYINDTYNPTQTYKDVKDFVHYGNDRSRILTVLKWGWAIEMFIID